MTVVRRGDSFVSDEALMEKLQQEGVSVSRGESGYSHVLAFELGRCLRRWRDFDEETVQRLMEIPEIKGMKTFVTGPADGVATIGLRDAVAAGISDLYGQRSWHQHD